MKNKICLEEKDLISFVLGYMLKILKNKLIVSDVNYNKGLK